MSWTTPRRALASLLLALVVGAAAGCHVPGHGGLDPDGHDDPGGSVVPTSFTFAVGGFLGPSFVFALEGDSVTVTEREHGGDQDPDVRTVTPTSEAWAAFRAELDALDVWSWEASYLNPDVADGTQWALGVAYDDGRAVESSGSNAFPGSPGPEYSAEFERLVAAVEALAAGA